MEGSPPQRWRRGARWPWKQELAGLLALAEGIALPGLLCFAPWFSWRGVNVILGQITTPAAELRMLSVFGPHSYSGWASAQGISIPDARSPFLGYLWLILLIGIALLCLAWLRLRRLLSARSVLAALLALSALALLIEAGLYFQAQLFRESLGAPFHDSYIIAGVSWGFWGAVAVNVAAIAAAGVALAKQKPT